MNLLLVPIKNEPDESLEDQLDGEFLWVLSMKAWKQWAQTKVELQPTESV